MRVQVADTLRMDVEDSLGYMDDIFRHAGLAVMTERNGVVLVI